MKVTKETYKSLLPSLKQGFLSLKGSDRRQFLGQLVLDIGYGGQSLVSKTFKVSRDTIRKGIKEVKSGNAIVDKFNE